MKQGDSDWNPLKLWLVTYEFLTICKLNLINLISQVRIKFVVQVE